VINAATVGTAPTQGCSLLTVARCSRAPAATRELGRLLRGLSVLIVGDIRHSRVARSAVLGLQSLAPV